MSFEDDARALVAAAEAAQRGDYSQLRALGYTGTDDEFAGAERSAARLRPDTGADGPVAPVIATAADGRCISGEGLAST